MNKYDDIINLPHWEPKFHHRMSEEDRAAQFAPFAALTGYDAMVRETSRLTDTKIELDDEQILALNKTLLRIIEGITNHPKVSVVWFKKDARKQGGRYVKTEDTVRNVDLANRVIIFRNGLSISLDDIFSIVLEE